MTDPTLPSQMEQEAVETGIVLAEDQPATEVESNEEKPAAQAKINGYLVPNRHDRRRAAAKSRRKSGKK